MNTLFYIFSEGMKSFTRASVDEHLFYIFSEEMKSFTSASVDEHFILYLFRGNEIIH